MPHQSATSPALNAWHRTRHLPFLLSVSSSQQVGLQGSILFWFVRGIFFLQEGWRKNFLLSICSSPPFTRVVLWRRTEREKKKIKFFKGTHYFSWNGILETLHHQGLLAWDLLYLHQGESVATPLRSLGELWRAAALPGRGVSPTQPSSSMRPAMGQALCQVQHGCKWMQGKEEINLHQPSLWDGHESAGAQMLERGSRGQSQHSKKSNRQQCVIPAGIRENRGNVYYFVTYFPTRLCSTCNSLSFRSLLDLALWVWTINYFQW